MMLRGSEAFVGLSMVQTRDNVHMLAGSSSANTEKN